VSSHSTVAFEPALISRLVDLIAGPTRPVVLIDGGSGAGKSTLADQLAAAIPARLVRLEGIYPGWDGLEAASEAVHRDILASEDPGWRSWNWTSSTPGESHSIDPSTALIIEGSGSLSRQNRALSTFGIWLTLDEATRRDRALARDGDVYAPHWERWAAQEARFAARERPEEYADVVLDVSTGQLGLHTTK
jgi:adenylate kinase family enzyme